jgi:hypothetical protein
MTTNRSGIRWTLRDGDEYSVRRYSQLQFSSPQSSEEFSPVQELQTRLLFVCNRFVKWIVVARPRKGQIKPSVKQTFHELLVTLPGNTWCYILRKFVLSMGSRGNCIRIMFSIEQVLVLLCLWFHPPRGSVTYKLHLFFVRIIFVQVADMDDSETSEVRPNWRLIGRLVDRMSFLTFAVTYFVLLIVYYLYYLWVSPYREFTSI